MSALFLETPTRHAVMARPGREDLAPMIAALAAVAGALAPWVLLVTAYGGLTRTAAACFTGPLAL